MSVNAGRVHGQLPGVHAAGLDPVANACCGPCGRSHRATSSRDAAQCRPGRCAGRVLVSSRPQKLRTKSEVVCGRMGTVGALWWPHSLAWATPTCYLLEGKAGLWREPGCIGAGGMPLVPWGWGLGLVATRPCVPLSWFVPPENGLRTVSIPHQV